MSGQRPPNSPPDDDRDWIDAIPGVDRVASNLERSLGPSCFLSLVISALILMLVRSWLRLPPLAMLVFTFFIWWCVMVVLVRFGPSQPDDDE